MKRNSWTFEETTVALGLYFQMPFGKIRHENPETIRVANLLGRSPSSLTMKVGNLARFDPTMKAKGISGLVNGAKMEGEVWAKYANQLDVLSEDYNALLKKLSEGKKEEKSPFVSDEEVLDLPPGLDKEHLAKYRVNQTFFRHAVLSAYGNACCITGIDDTRLLTASHIKPWAKCATGAERTTPANGLCLNALHDKAFDRGLITLDDEGCVILSSSLKDALTVSMYEEFFVRYEGKKIAPPKHHAPLEEFLAYHREHIFVA